MYDPAHDRRKHGAFRILYIDFSAFWNRIILRRKEVTSTPKRPAPAPQPGQAQADRKTGVGFTTGVSKLDEHHHEIREAILAFQKELGRNLPVEDHLQSLDRLLQQMNAHFQYEESYLEHIRFPDLQHHKEEHDHFRTDAWRLRERLAEGDTGVPLELSTYLFNWFRRHTLEEDAAFAKTKRRP